MESVNLKLVFQKVRNSMIKEKITALIKKDPKTNKKKVENLAFIVILLVITLFSIKNIFKNERNLKYDDEVKFDQKIEKLDEERNIEKELESILSKIKGVEKVNVLITYSETQKLVPLYNENSSRSSTEEKDNDGGERKIESTDVNKEVVADSNQTPITEKIIYPKMEGAIIIAKGADNILVKEKIISAVEAATGLPTHKIQVFEMKGE